MRVRAFLLAVLALTQILLGALSCPSVICIEPDGAFRVEHDGAACCDDAEELGAPTEAGPSVTADCCACVDVALPTERDRSAVKTSEPLPLAPPSLAVAGCPAADVRVVATGTRRSIDEAPPLAPLRPTVLRC